MNNKQTAYVSFTTQLLKNPNPHQLPVVFTQFKFFWTLHSCRTSINLLAARTKLLMNPQRFIARPESRDYASQYALEHCLPLLDVMFKGLMLGTQTLNNKVFPLQHV
jgi:hypothetical protein